MFVVKTAEYEKSAVHPGQYPDGNLPEIAFAGRSNVGKSSLINSLVNRKKLVKTSRTPGHTRSINFFKINGSWYFVDLPGYGYAKVSESLQASWKPMVEHYLTERQNLRGVVHIMDIRHLPSADDVSLWFWLKGRGIMTFAVMTKADKLSRGRHRLRLNDAAALLGLSPDEIIVFSALTHMGRDKLIGALSPLIAPTGVDRYW